MLILNPDGSQAEACGNATRCVARLIMGDGDPFAQIPAEARCTITTVAGDLACRMRADGWIAVDMGSATVIRHDQSVPGGFDPATTVSVGNPHAVVFLDDLSDLDPTRSGPPIETDAAFPHRTNVEFIQVLDRGHVRLRMWERGAGVTLACGSGACAVAAATVARGLTDRTVRITLDGGDLEITITPEGRAVMAGPTTHVADAVLSPEMLAQITPADAGAQAAA